MTTDGGKICPSCREKILRHDSSVPLDNLIIASSYKENSISHLIHLYKYNFVKDLSVPLGQLLIKSIIQNNLPLPDAIIPVPLHPRRLRWRGFNQAELLANYISNNLTPGFPIPVFSDILCRKRYTKPQMKIKNYKERQKNISGAFFMTSKKSVGDKNFCPDEDKNFCLLQNKNILLIDDIATTGSTILECAKVLKRHGARRVSGLVLARQEFKKSPPPQTPKRP